MAIAPLIIRWGPETSSDVLRRRARCSRCGNRRVSLKFEPPAIAGRAKG